MLKSVEGIVGPDGTTRTLEPLPVKVATRAIVTLLEEGIDSPVWRAYQESKQERGEVYHRLAES